MNEARRVVVVGGGMNGLVCAALLARRGVPVTLLEAREGFGGLSAPLEVEGALAPPILPGLGMFEDAVSQELSLERQGLAWEPAAPLRVAAPDRSLRLPAAPWAEPSRLESVPEAERGAWTELASFLARTGAALRELLQAPAPDPFAPGLGGALGLLGAGWRLRRRLGRADLTELARVAPAPLADVLEDRLGDPLLRVALAAPALLGVFGGPRSPLTGIGLLLRAAREQPRRPAGGPGALVEALLGAARAAGAELRAAAPVSGLLVRDGVVRGVVLGDGEELAGCAVVATCDPRRTVLDLLPAREAPTGLVDAAERYRGRGTLAVLGLSLEASSEWPGGKAGDATEILVAAGLDDLQRAFEPVKYGQLPERPFLHVRLAPEAGGGTAATVLAAHVPADPEGGWSPGLRKTLEDRILDRLEEICPGLRGRIQARRLLVPPDLDEEFGLAGGHLLHGEEAADQLFAFRPWLPAEGSSRAPMPGLFLGGGGSHPGGWPTGGPGRLAARAVRAAGA